MYFGESISKVDDKGRITVPRRMRETMDVLGHHVWYMTRGFDGCIFLFHRDEWNCIREQNGKHPAMDARVLDFRRLFFSSVSEVKPDGQGRLSVAPHLREHARLDKEAVIIGVDDHLEIWSKEGWQEYLRAKEADYKAMASAMFAPNGTDAPEDEEKGEQSHAS